MPINRRDFMKIGAAAGAAALFGWYVNRVNERTISASEVPGSGEVGHFSKEIMADIDVGAYLGACSRCGVCITECPFQAIKSEGWQLPQLTDLTRHKCPGYDVCGACYAVCPTSALSQAMETLRTKHHIESGIKKSPWWKGEKIDTDLITRPDPDIQTVDDGGE